VAIANPATASTPASNRVLMSVSSWVIALLSNVPGRARFLRELNQRGIYLLRDAVLACIVMYLGEDKS
jgi:hypothetical protein